MSQPGRVVFHVDLDAFYVSVESREDPSLKGKPLVVGADPEGGRGRGVVIACSYEARKFGLRSGMPISQAFRMCPQATYMPPDFPLYERVSEQVMVTLKRFATSFEQMSIDEAFLEVTGKVRGDEEARRLALLVKEAVRNEHGLTCSVGVAPNKSCAKIASDRDKPDGLTLVSAGKVEEFLAPLPVTVVPGVGRKTSEFLREQEIETIGDLQRLEGRQLLTWFGKNGVWLWGVVHGQENTAVKQQDLPKSLSVERTFREDVTDFRKVHQESSEAASELMRRVHASQLVYRVGGIKIRFQGFETHTRERSLVSHTDSEDALQEVVRSLLEEFEGSGRAVRLIGVRVSDLKRKESQASSLDDWVGAPAG